MFGAEYIYRFNAALTKLLSGKGGEPMEALAPELLACLIVDNDPPELALYKNEMMWFGTVLGTALAANYTYAMCSNPAGSGVLVRVERIIITNATGAAQDFFVQRNLGGAITSQSIFVRDGRARGTPATQLGFRQTGALSLTGLYVGIDANLKSVVVDGPFVLKPGDDIVVAPNIVNVVNRVAFIGRERPAEATELV